jgi:hypothetical protein
VERETGFEPATSTLARLHSTAELFPHCHDYTRPSRSVSTPNSCFHTIVDKTDKRPRTREPRRAARDPLDSRLIGRGVARNLCLIHATFGGGI